MSLVSDARHIFRPMVLRMWVPDLSPALPQPGNYATLIPGLETEFGCRSGTHIRFTDDKGEEVYERELQEESSVNISPEEIGMKPGVIYIWSVVGVVRENIPLYARLLADDVNLQITADLKRIDTETISSVEKAFKKAAYLQFVSDVFPHEIGLYWLSYRMLSEGRLLLEKMKLSKETTEQGETRVDYQAIADELEQNFRRHLLPRPERVIEKPYP